MNDMKIFENPEFGKVRTIVINDEPWFVGKDVASVLGYSNPSKAVINHVDAEDKQILSSQNGNLENIPNRGVLIINESGLYSLIISSKLPSAKKFKRWVTSEVLPAIRKHGAYLTTKQDSYAIEDPIERAKRWIEEQKELKETQKQLEIAKPKVLFADSVSSSDTSILIGVLAKIIKQNGVDHLTINGKQKPMGQNNFFKWLRENGYLISRKGDSWNTPTQKAMDKGLFEVKESTAYNQDGSVRITKTTMVTGKGQQYFINKFLGQDVPSITSQSEKRIGLPAAE